MSVSDDYRAAVAHLRGWGFQVVEWSGCYGRSNGGGWSAGVPVGHVNHHYVCSMNPDQGYINNLVANLANGSVVNWFADVHGVAYLIGTGPMNHAGTGNQSVLDRTRSDEPPPGPATSQGSISGNSHYSGTECQHPGDSTPWPGPMLDVMVGINAAEFLVWGYTAQRAINHFEWTNRKIDMSAGGGPNSGGWAGDELRRRVATRMTGQGGDWFDMATEEDLYNVVHRVINEFQITSGVDGKVYTLPQYVQSLDKRTTDMAGQVADIQARIRGPIERPWDQLQDIQSTVNGIAPQSADTNRRVVSGETYTLGDFAVSADNRLIDLQNRVSTLEGTTAEILAEVSG